MVRIRVPGAVGGVVKGAGVLDDISEIIRNPPPTPVGGAIGRGGQKFCDYLSAAPALAFGILQSQGVIGAIVCDPYYRDAGVSPPEQGPPPFTGGQCEGTAYFIRYRFSVDGITSGEQSVNFLGGPIGRRKDVLGPNSFALVITHFSAAGDPLEFLVGNFFNVQSGPDWVEFVVEPVSGPDDCGDPQGEFNPGPNPAPLPPNYNPGADFGVDDTGAPFFDVPGIDNPFGGNPIPFDDPFSTPDSTEPPTPPQPSGDGIPGEDDSVGGAAGEIVGGGDGSEVDFGQPPPNKIWVGCLVEYEAETSYGGISGTSPENTVYPTVIGNVSLKFTGGRGESKPVRSRWVELSRPSTSLVVTGAFVQARLGATATVFPLSATVCKEVSCLSE